MLFQRSAGRQPPQTTSSNIPFSQPRKKNYSMRKVTSPDCKLVTLVSSEERNLEMRLLPTVEVAAVAGDAADAGVGLYLYVKHADERVVGGSVRMRQVKRDGGYEALPGDSWRRR